MNCKNKSFMTKRKAFTLIELLIVIAIIGILFIVLVSKVDFATDKAKASGVQTDFRSFQMAFDTVAKENAGFNTFGYNTGDNAGGVTTEGGAITLDGKAYTYTNALKDLGDGKRNSYDVGDDNLDGIQNNGEVWTGRKVYTETFTNIYTLMKPGTSVLDTTRLAKLETAINANLDPKLHITIKDDGEILMANGAQDPWNNEYHGYYISKAAEQNGADRGAIVMYSDGANGVWGSAHDIDNGVVSVTVPNSNKDGKDDYSIVSVYTFVNGYGEVKNITTGFSNNQTFLGGNASNVEIDAPGEGNNVIYNIITGADQSVAVNASGAEFASNADFNKFVKVVVDTTDLVENEHYTVHSGSTVVTLKPTFIATLNIGEHTMYIYSDDGVASCKFYIEQATNTMLAGGYDADGELVVDFDTLVNTYGWQPESDYSYGDDSSNPSHINNILKNDALTSVVKIVFPDTCSKIGRRVFYNNNQITEIDMGNGIMMVDWSAFESCKSLQTVKCSPNCTTIYHCAFQHCSNLSEIILPEKLEHIGQEAFSGTNITTMTLPNGLKKLDMNALIGLDVKEITLPGSLESIGSGALSTCYSLEKVYIEPGITAIPNSMFYSCIALKEVVLPEGIVSIGNQAFSYCQKLTDINLPNSITTIGDKAFSCCSVLTNITLPSSLESIGSNAFDCCYALTSIEIPSNIKALNSYVFQSCRGLTTIVLHNNIESIGYAVFQYANSLTEIVFHGTKSEWEAIQKNASWNVYSKITTITCSDGTISLS